VAARKRLSLPRRGSRAELAQGAADTQVAAAVAYRRDGDRLEVRLVRTSDGARWTLPKGRRERGESLAVTAAREAAEEAGVTGVVAGDPLIEYRHAPSRHAGRADDPVSAFLLDVREAGPSTERGRDPAWFDLRTAQRKLAEGREAFYAQELERVLVAAERELRSR